MNLNKKYRKEEKKSFSVFMSLVKPPPPRRCVIQPPPSINEDSEFVTQETTINVAESIRRSEERVLMQKNNADPFSNSNENVKCFSYQRNVAVLGENSENPLETTPNFLRWKNEVWFPHLYKPRSEEELDRLIKENTHESKKFRVCGNVKSYNFTIERDFTIQENRETDIDNIGLENDVKKKWAELLSAEDIEEEEEETTPFNHFGFRSPLQRSLCDSIFDYRDVLFTASDARETSAYQEAQESWMLHIINHLTKTKRYQHYNDLKRQNIHPRGRYDVRDRGFFRPSILIVVPYKHDAYEIVNLMKKLVPKCFTNSPIEKEEAFELLFGESYQRKGMNYRADWRRKMFEGNIEDSFCVGVGFSPGHMELMVMDEFEADIIIATPLGLQQLFRKRPKKDELRLALASIEICVMVRAELLAVLQNWEVFINIWSSLNHPPLRAIPDSANEPGHVRSYFFEEGLARKFRQTLIFSSLRNVDVENIFFRAENIRGKVRIVDKNLPGCLLPRYKDDYPKQSLIHIKCPLNEIDQRRYDVFCQKIVPLMLESKHVFLVIVSNYYEFARLRAFLSKECKGGGTFLCISDYDGNYAMNLQKYRTEKTQIILYTERHYLTTPRVKLSNFRASQFLFYSLPNFGHLYRRVMNHCVEIRNRKEKSMLMEKQRESGKNRRNKRRRGEKKKKIVNNKGDKSEIMVRVLWSKYDKFKMERCLGVSLTEDILQSEKGNIII